MIRAPLIVFPAPGSPMITTTGDLMFVRLDLSQRLRPISRPEAVVSNVCGRCEPLHEDSAGMKAAREWATSVSSRPFDSLDASPTSVPGYKQCNAEGSSRPA